MRQDLADRCEALKERLQAAGKTKDPKQKRFRRSYMNPARVTELCTEADKAFQKLRPRQSIATFYWRGWKFKAYCSNFRLKVDTAEGEPVACRYF